MLFPLVLAWKHVCVTRTYLLITSEIYDIFLTYLGTLVSGPWPFWAQPLPSMSTMSSWVWPPRRSLILVLGKGVRVGGKAPFGHNDNNSL